MTTTMTKDQAQLKTSAPPDPEACKQAWHEANEAVKITSLRVRRCKDARDETEQKIKGATQNGHLTGAARETMADLGQRLSTDMRKLEEAEAQHKQAQNEHKIAWKAWEPFAAAVARQVDAPRIPRVAALIEANRRTKAGVGSALPTAPQGRADPTAPLGSPPTKAKAAVEVQVAKRPTEGLAALRGRTEATVQPRQAAKDRGIDLTGATGTALPKKDRTDMGADAYRPAREAAPAKGSRQLRAEARAAKGK
jgi:hypothetical protein